MSGNKIKCPFTLFSIDTMQLVEHITTLIDDSGREVDRETWKETGRRRRFERADFDVMENGDIMVYVEGKEPLKL